MSSPTAATVARRRRGPSGPRAASPPPGTASRWGQQRALKAALLATLGAACCIAFLRAGLPFHDQSTHPDEDPFLQVDEGGQAGGVEEDGWPVMGGVRWRGCAGEASALPAAMAGRGGEEQGSYLLVQLAGGLNQMRAGICDAVVVAKLLGASLMLPLLDNSSWWADGSTFADVFDAGHFARALAPWVRVVDRLPSALRHRPALERTVPRGSTAEYYETHVRPMIRKAQVLKLNHFDSRLHDQLPLDLQKLRCMANYEAVRFVPAVTQAVTRLTHALTHPSATAASTALHTAKHAAQAGGAAVGAAAAAQGAQGQGGEREQVEGGMQAKGSGKAIKYVAIHLRYEPDMLAFTGCEYEGGTEEKAVFDSIRQRWANLPAMDAEKQRAKGMCIVTPSQVAVALQALGLPSSTRVYIASGALHGGPAALQPLLRAFPFTTDKHSLAHSHAMAHAHTRARDDDEDEGDEAWGGGGKGGVGAAGGGDLAGMEGRKTLLAAVDYEMCRGAALLVTNNNGNMAHLLAGHRRYNGVGGTVHLFGSSIHRLLAAIQQGDHEASQKLRNRLLKGDLSTQTESNEKAAAKGGFWKLVHGVLRGRTRCPTYCVLGGCVRRPCDYSTSQPNLLAARGGRRAAR
ncbi:unnamed protein product [Closterium sp. NIES-54]